MTAFFPDFRPTPPPCRQFFSTICWQFLTTFDHFPLSITDVFHGWPLRVDLGKPSISLFFMIVTVQAVAIVEQSRFAHTWIKRMKGDIRQERVQRCRHNWSIAFVNRQETVQNGEGNNFSLFLLSHKYTKVTISRSFCSFSLFFWL